MFPRSFYWIADCSHCFGLFPELSTASFCCVVPGVVCLFFHVAWSPGQSSYCLDIYVWGWNTGKMMVLVWMNTTSVRELSGKIEKCCQPFVDFSWLILFLSPWLLPYLGIWIHHLVLFLWWSSVSCWLHFSLAYSLVCWLFPLIQGVWGEFLLSPSGLRGKCRTNLFLLIRLKCRLQFVILHFN